MINAIYDLLDKIGYAHPIHPALTHLPIGFVAAAFFLGWAGLWSKRKWSLPCGYPLLVLTLIFWFPTVVFGYMDWQRYYGGALLHPIVVKMVLAGVLLLLVVAGLVIGARDRADTPAMLVVYTLSLATVIALGYFGGQLVYAGAAPAGKGQSAGG